jgi:hypothetical protein
VCNDDIPHFSLYIMFITCLTCSGKSCLRQRPRGAGLVLGNEDCRINVLTVLCVSCLCCPLKDTGYDSNGRIYPSWLLVIHTHVCNNETLILRCCQNSFNLCKYDARRPNTAVGISSLGMN